MNTESPRTVNVNVREIIIWGEAAYRDGVVESQAKLVPNFLLQALIQAMTLYPASWDELVDSFIIIPVVNKSWRFSKGPQKQL